jgi:hypothetical protein
MAVAMGSQLITAARQRDTVGAHILITIDHDHNAPF